MPVSQAHVPQLTDLHSRSNHLPPHYIRPISDRPNLQDVLTSDGSIPLIDLHALDGPNHAEIVSEIGLACKTYGFFQVKNHGIPQHVIEDMLHVSKEFFGLPESEKLKSYSEDPSKTTRLSTSFNIKREKVSNWRDYLRLHCYPLQDFIEEWPTNPPSFRQVVGEYCTWTRGLVLKLLEAISESLGLEKDYIEKALGKQAQHMAINHYPRCPQPELTYGLPGHTDPNALTVLLQDQVSGLQVRQDRKWVAVDPIPDTFVVNIGDQIQDSESSSNSLHRSVSSHPIAADKTETKGLHPSNQLPNQHHVIDIMESDGHANDPNPSTASDREQVAGQRNHPGNQYAPEKWSEQLFVMAIACILALLGISDYNVNSNGTFTPRYLFHRHPYSFHFYLIGSMAAFFLSIIAKVFERASRALAEAIFGVALIGILLSVTVLLWELLPDELSWLPWVFFVLTLLAIFGRPACQHAAK